jgi:hypothetical protein
VNAEVLFKAALAFIGCLAVASATAQQEDQSVQAAGRAIEDAAKVIETTDGVRVARVHSTLACPQEVFEKSAQCYMSNRQSQRDGLLSCFPFSKPERIAGTWALGFELNEFYEGTTALPDRRPDRQSYTSLIPADAPRVGRGPAYFHVDFVGRRSLCDMGVPRAIIVVDKFVARQKMLHR